MEIQTRITDELIEEECYEFDENELVNTLLCDFEDFIADRGEEYYNNGRVKNVYKSGNVYYAKVFGNDDNEYNVRIDIYDEYSADYECSCPYKGYCKHEYAVILAISNKEYEEVILKEKELSKTDNIKSIIKKIPAKELKDYLLNSRFLDNIIANENEFKEHFRKYYPKQEYEYYYNNLYNELVLDTDYNELVNNYVEDAREYLDSSSFEEVFKIIRSIVEAFNDSNRLNKCDNIFDIISSIGILLRITYRKADKNLKKEIDKWSTKVKGKNYYDNYYLEDMIISLK